MTEIMVKAKKEGLMDDEVWQSREQEIKAAEKVKALMRKKGLVAQNLFGKRPHVELPEPAQQGTIEPQPTIVKLPPLPGCLNHNLLET